MNTYYVDLAGGNDSNNGTAAATPWLTLSHADATISLATNGAVINVCDAVSLNTLQTVNAYVQLNKIGTSTQPIVYQSNVFAGCTRGAKITFVGDIASSAIVMAGHYTTLQGFELTGATTNVIGAYGDKEQILYNNIHDITSTATCPATGAIQQVQAFDINPGLGVTHSDLGFTVRGNIIANVNPAGGRNVNCSEYHAIYSKFPSSTIQDNLIFNEGGGWGIQLFGYGCYDVITNNTVWGAEKGGIVFSHGDWSNDSLAVNQCPGGGKPENFITFSNNILANTQSSNAAGSGSAITIFGSCAAGPGPYGTSNLISNNQAEFNVGTNGLTRHLQPIHRIDLCESCGGRCERGRNLLKLSGERIGNLLAGQRIERCAGGYDIVRADAIQLRSHYGPSAKLLAAPQLRCWGLSVLKSLFVS